MTIKDKIKQLELQVDQLIGYRPSGHPWKHEYLLRASLLEHTHDPKVQAIQTKLKKLYKQLPYRQGYIYYNQQEYWKPKEEHPPIKIMEWDGGKYIERII
jgi:hypothetical protein